MGGERQQKLRVDGSSPGRPQRPINVSLYRKQQALSMHIYEVRLEAWNDVILLNSLIRKSDNIL